jgi:hypothetical protein
VPADRRCVEAMSTNKLTLLLAELEIEVVEEALDLYLRARPAPADHRFEYRYRAAQSVRDSLRYGTNAPDALAQADADDSAHRAAGRPEIRKRREQVED